MDIFVTKLVIMIPCVLETWKYVFDPVLAIELSACNVIVNVVDSKELECLCADCFVICKRAGHEVQNGRQTLVRKKGKKHH